MNWNLGPSETYGTYVDKLFMQYTKPVSYTHLDVYKRQVTTRGRY